MKKKSLKSDGRLRDAYLNFTETFSELFTNAGQDILSAQPANIKVKMMI